MNANYSVWYTQATHRIFRHQQSPKNNKFIAYEEQKKLVNTNKSSNVDLLEKSMTIARTSDKSSGREFSQTLAEPNFKPVPNHFLQKI